jgi:hypothetical protein
LVLPRRSRPGPPRRGLRRRRRHEELGYAPHRFRVRWGGARIRDRYRWAEWRGHISIHGTSVNSWTARGLEHPEESIIPTGDGVFTVHTDTYGDADHLEIEVASLSDLRLEIDLAIGAFRKTSDALSFHPDPQAPGVRTTLTGKQLLAQGHIDHPLDGKDLFVSVERVTDQALPCDLTATHRYVPTPGPHAHRALYVFARERNDDKIWTSPLFIHTTP